MAFLGSTRQVGLRQRWRAVAGGLTPRAGREQFCAVPMVDVDLPTTASPTVLRPRHPQPENALEALLAPLHRPLPAQPPPKSIAATLPSAPREGSLQGCGT